MHIIFLTKILGIFAVSLNPIIIQNWVKKKNASKVPNNLLKSNCEFEGLGKFKMMLIVNMFKILSNHKSGSTTLENKTVSYWMEQYLKFVKYWYNTFYHRNNFGKKN